jgi:transcriptional regulator with XRE-family HTH domain
MSKFIDTLKDRLRKCNSNLNKFAEKSGISRNAFEHWRHSPGAIKVSTLCKIVDALIITEQEYRQSLPETPTEPVVNFQTTVLSFCSLIKSEMQEKE